MYFSYTLRNIMNKHFTFIDLFAGIGGFRLALESLGGQCVFSSEIDKIACEYYQKNHGEMPFGDITSNEVKAKIPREFDILCGGFPCQAFSIAGRRLGFKDTRGTLFFEIADILQKHRPKAFILENVVGLLNHNKGSTFNVILDVLNELKYFVKYEVLNALDFGVPQRRKRIFIVGFLDYQHCFNYKFPQPTNKNVRFGDIMETGEIDFNYYISQRYLDYLYKRSKDNKNGFVRLQPLQNNSVVPTLTKNIGSQIGGLLTKKEVAENKLKSYFALNKNNEFLRQITPREMARCQGFPESFIIPKTKTTAEKLFGNSVAVPCVKAVAENVIKVL